MLDAQAVAPTAGEGGAMDDGVGGTEEAEQELLAALAPVEENKATDAENPPLQTGPPLYIYNTPFLRVFRLVFFTLRLSTATAL